MSSIVDDFVAVQFVTYDDVRLYFVRKFCDSNLISFCYFCPAQPTGHCDISFDDASLIYECRMITFAFVLCLAALHEETFSLSYQFLLPSISAIRSNWTEIL